MCQSSGHSDVACYVWGFPHIYEDSQVATKMFTLHRK